MILPKVRDLRFVTIRDDLAGGDRALAAADGMAAVGPATDPISIQVRGLPRSVRSMSAAIIASAVETNPAT